MRLRTHAHIWAVLVVGLLAGLLPSVAAAEQSPLPRSAYSTAKACGAPLPGQASCFAVGLVPKTPAARAHSHPLGMTLTEGTAAGDAANGAYGLRPQDLHSAYQLPLDAPTAQTVGIVDAYDDPNIEADLKVYDEEFGLPACTKANGCFRKLNQRGNEQPLPQAEGDWAGEISLDVETVHAVCQSCHILLIEADASWNFDLEEAVETAERLGAEEISNSYGSGGFGAGPAYDDPGTVITASTGDWGYDNWVEPAYGTNANYPAASPDVVAVGGTKLFLSGDGEWAGESAWEEGGSGCASTTGTAPSWQTSVPDWAQVGCGTERAIADVSADADPYTGVAIYDTTPNQQFSPGWITFGGTSLSSPIIAAAFALAGGAHGVAYPAQTLYEYLGSSSLHDITTGSNGDCSTALICNAAAGYDGPTGVGSPAGLGALIGGPALTSVSPVEGPSTGGTMVTIGGTKLADAVEVDFGGHPARIVADTEGSITVESPAEGAARVDVRVIGPGGTTPIVPADHYTYRAPPAEPSEPVAPISFPLTEAPAGTSPAATSPSATGTSSPADTNGAALHRCLAAAQKAYLHSVHVAHSLSKGRGAALRRAQRRKAAQAAACRRRY
jgi:IPT/TIG domain-containing protein/subtilase family protein